MDEGPSGMGSWRALLLVAVCVGLVLAAAGLVAMATSDRGPGAASEAASPSPTASAARAVVHCTPGWVVAPDAGPGGDLEHRLVAVGGSGPRDLWAVGSRFANENSNAEPLIEHWNGTSWTRVAVPIDAQIGELSDVAVLSPDDAWAVGTGSSVLHWDGRTWSVFPTRPAGAHSGGFDAIAAADPSNVWVLGSSAPTAPNGESIRRDVFEHWDGRRWHVFHPPQVDWRTGSGGMQDVAVNRRGNVWAIGGAASGFGEAGRPDRALVDRLTSGRWIRAATPADPAPLTVLTVTPSGTVWAATGTTLHTAGSYGIGIPQNVERWDGHRWTIEQTLRGIGVTGMASDARSVWVAGRTWGSRGRPFLESWRGGRWERVPLGPAGHIARVHYPYESRTPAVATTADGSVVALDTEGTPRSGQRNFLWTHCAVASDA